METRERRLRKRACHPAMATGVVDTLEG